MHTSKSNKRAQQLYLQEDAHRQTAFAHMQMHMHDTLLYSYITLVHLQLSTSGHIISYQNVCVPLSLHIKTNMTPWWSTWYKRWWHTSHCSSIMKNGACAHAHTASIAIYRFFFFALRTSVPSKVSILYRNMLGMPPLNSGSPCCTPLNRGNRAGCCAVMLSYINVKFCFGDWHLCFFWRIAAGCTEHTKAKRKPAQTGLGVPSGRHHTTHLAGDIQGRCQKRCVVPEQCSVHACVI